MLTGFGDRSVFLAAMLLSGSVGIQTQHGFAADQIHDLTALERYSIAGAAGEISGRPRLTFKYADADAGVYSRAQARRAEMNMSPKSAATVDAERERAAGRGVQLAVAESSSLSANSEAPGEDGSIVQAIWGLFILALAVLAALAGLSAAWRIRHDAWRLHALSRQDALTRLPNRQFILEELRDLAARRPINESFAVHRVDIARFRRINDCYGQEIADAALVEIAHRFRKIARPSDIVGRIDGDEFLIIQRRVASDADVQEMALRLCEACRVPLSEGRVPLELNCSVGSVPNAERRDSHSNIMRCADLALAAAKKEGLNCVRLFEKSMLNDDIEAEKIEAGLRRAIADNALQIFYQPIINASEQRIKSVEALVRWSDPILGDVSPGKFIPIAERSGLIVPISDFVLRRACRDISRLPIEGLCLSVNISAIDFYLSDVNQAVWHALHESGLDSSRLTIEITESFILGKSENDLSQIERLRQMGVRVSLDDFGTGYSSLSYLHSFPLDCIKIDQSFVRRIVCDEKVRAIVKAIIDIARGLDVYTVAEGVETAAQAGILIELGATHLQGYYFGKPMPLESLISHLDLCQACYP